MAACSRMIFTALLALFGATSSRAGVIETADQDLWEAAAGAFTTIDFTGWPNGTFITEQYSDLGVHFTDGNDFVELSDNAFPNDGAGLAGSAFSDIVLAFDQPTHWLAVDFPGLVQIELYSAGVLIHTTQTYGQNPVGNFLGIVSSASFDGAVILDPTGAVFIDDLHFGPPIPAPAGIGLLAVAGLVTRRGKRV